MSDGLEYMKSDDFVITESEDLNIEKIKNLMESMIGKLLEFGKKIEKMKIKNEDLKSFSVLMKKAYNESSLLTILESKYKDRLLLWNNSQKYILNTKIWNETIFTQLNLIEIENTIRQFEQNNT